MTTATLSYSINDLSRLSGIKAHTIRIWEKRYGLFDPARTETNIRLYDDNDLRKILNVNTLLKEGWKISKISELSIQDIESAVWHSAKTGNDPGQVYEIYMQAMVSASLSFDEEWFETVFAEATSRFGMQAVMQHVVGPFLARIGLMWIVLRMHPGQEHFASNLIRRKLLSAIDKLPKHGSKGKFLLFLPPWEEHEIGLIYSEFLVRAAGYEVVYLGQRVPVQALAQTIEAVRPTGLLTFFVADRTPEEYQALISEISQIFKGSAFGIAARPELRQGIDRSDQIVWLDSPKALQELL